MARTGGRLEAGPRPLLSGNPRGFRCLPHESAAGFGLHFEALPLRLNVLHQRLEARLLPEVLEERIVLCKKGIVDEAVPNRVLQPVQRLVRLTDQRLAGQ
jgi:hypothetical protein